MKCSKTALATICVVVSFIIFDLSFGMMMDYFSSHSRGGDTRNVDYICRMLDDSIVVFGSSRANHHYDTRILTDSLGISAYNCGIDGNGILLAHIFLKNIIAHGGKPNLIIYDFFPTFDLYDNNDHERATNIVAPYFKTDGMKEIFDELAPSEYQKLYLSTYRYNTKFIQIVSDALRPRQLTINGYKPIGGTMSTDFPETDNTMGAIDDVKITYFKKFLKLCNDNSINVVFVMSPLFQILENPRHDSLMLKKYIGESYRFFDFRQHSDFLRNKDLFTDPIHLNHQGAEKFTRYLIDSIRQE